MRRCTSSAPLGRPARSSSATMYFARRRRRRTRAPTTARSNSAGRWPPSVRAQKTSAEPMRRPSRCLRRRRTVVSTSGSSGIRDGILRARTLESAPPMPRLLLVLLACLAPACAVTREKPQPDGVRRTQVGETRVAWENRGGGDEALVFVHGWGGDRTLWAGQMEDLVPWRRIAIDLPGHGASDKPQVEYTVDRMVAALLAVLDDAGVARAVLVGHSSGALTVRRMLELHPERVAGLVLVDGPLKSFFDSPEQGREFLAPLSGPGGEAWLANVVDGMLVPMRDAAQRKRVRAVMLGTPRRVLVSSFEATLDPALWTAQPIRVPLLLVLARQPAWDEAYHDFARKLAPGLRWEVLDGVSHFLMIDDPAR